MDAIPGANSGGIASRFETRLAGRTEPRWAFGLCGNTRNAETHDGLVLCDWTTNTSNDVESSPVVTAEDGT